MKKITIFILLGLIVFAENNSYNVYGEYETAFVILPGFGELIIYENKKIVNAKNEQRISNAKNEQQNKILNDVFLYNAFIKKFLDQHLRHEKCFYTPHQVFIGDK